MSSAGPGSAAAAPPPGPDPGERTPRCKRRSGPPTAGEILNQSQSCSMAVNC